MGTDRTDRPSRQTQEMMMNQIPEQVPDEQVSDLEQVPNKQVPDFEQVPDLELQLLTRDECTETKGSTCGLWEVLTILVAVVVSMYVVAFFTKKNAPSASISTRPDACCGSSSQGLHRQR